MSALLPLPYAVSAHAKVLSIDTRLVAIEAAGFLPQCHAKVCLNVSRRDLSSFGFLRPPQPRSLPVFLVWKWNSPAVLCPDLSGH